MQLVLSNNRVIAHGENFLAMGGVVINTETGAKFENATVAECDGCPSDIDNVGYEYHGGVFVPCAPYGTGNNNGYFMEVCETCATPRSSGIPIKGGIKNENINPEVTARTLGGMDIELLWENAKPTSSFGAQTITLIEYDWTFLICETNNGSFLLCDSCTPTYAEGLYFYSRSISATSKTKVSFSVGSYLRFYTTSTVTQYSEGTDNGVFIPSKIYGVKI